MANSTGRGSDKFMLRLPDGMRERIKLAAEVNKRSMNAEIVATLYREYPAPDGFDPMHYAYMKWLAIGPNATDQQRQKVVEQVNQTFDAEGVNLAISIDSSGTMSFKRLSRD